MASDEAVRIDKWLWAARFFKTRSLAADAVEGGKVHLNGARTKPSHSLHPGDELKVRRGPYESVVIVRGLSEHRGPAEKARALYEETEESQKAREALSAQLRLERGPAFESEGRPSKKDRRDILGFKRKGW
ncbi:MAG TPA: S4 domain-containing protein [Candidatus Binatia bacterium]